MDARVRRRAMMLVALAATAPALAGCVNIGQVVRDEVPLVQRTLVDETTQFSTAPSGPPTVPPSSGGAAKLYNIPFDVPVDATDLNVTIIVTFGAPPPDPLPQGQVDLELIAPADSSDEISLTRDGTYTWLKPAPTAGTWALDIQATGEGRIQVLIKALAPRAAR